MKNTVWKEISNILVVVKVINTKYFKLKAMIIMYVVFNFVVF